MNVEIYKIILNSRLLKIFLYMEIFKLIDLINKWDLPYYYIFLD